MSLFSKKTLPSTDPAGTAYSVAKTDEDWRAEIQITYRFEPRVSSGLAEEGSSVESFKNGSIS